MVSAETLLSYTDWKMPFTVHTGAYDKQLGAVISHNKNPIHFFSRRLSKPQCNYTTTEKELLHDSGMPQLFPGNYFWL